MSVGSHFRSPRQPDSGPFDRQSGDPRGNHTWSGLLRILMPATCRICRACVEESDFCGRCEARLSATEPRMRSACPRCGRPRGAAVDVADLCADCRQEPYAFDRCIGLWTYEGAVKDVVVASKFGSQIVLADAVARRLADRCRDAFAGDADPPSLVTSVPSHFLRRIHRGYGGSRLLADVVASRLARFGLPCERRSLLAATRRLGKQAWTDRKGREKNVAGAFRIAQPLSAVGLKTDIRGKHVLLVDDVLTTGATASEVARVLKGAGARRVTVAVVARAAAC